MDFMKPQALEVMSIPPDPTVVIRPRFQPSERVCRSGLPSGIWAGAARFRLLPLAAFETVPVNVMSVPLVISRQSSDE